MRLKVASHLASRGGGGRRGMPGCQCIIRLFLRRQEYKERGRERELDKIRKRYREKKRRKMGRRNA